MLSDEQKEQLATEIIPFFQELEQDVIKDIARRVHKTDRWTETAELQVKALEKLGYSPAKIQAEVWKTLHADPDYKKIVAENTLEYKHEITKKINDIVKQAQAAGDDIIGRAGNMDFADDVDIWAAQGRHLKKSPALEQIGGVMAKRLRGDLKTLSQSTGFRTMGMPVKVTQAYNHALDRAITNAASGAFSSAQAVEMAMDEMEKSGLRKIDFASGVTRNLDVAAMLAVRTTISQMAGEISLANAESLGTDLVEVSSHPGARTGEGHGNHAAWQGKVYSISGRPHPEESKRLGYTIEKLSDATGYPDDPAGLKGYNCRHDFYPFIEGASEPNPMAKEPDRVTIDGKTYTYYQATQKQRAIERELRELKRRYIGGRQELAGAIKAKEQQYARYCEKAGLKQNLNRLYVKGYKRDFEYIKPVERPVVSKTTNRFTKDSIKQLSRKELEHYATDIYARKQVGISYDEGVRRAKALMDGNTDAQLKKYVLKYQSELKPDAGNGIIKSAKDIIHLGQKEDLSSYDLTKVAPAQDKHIVGTNSYKNLSGTRAYPPSYLTISNEKVSKLVQEYAGKGINLYNSKGDWTHTEIIVTNNEKVGFVVNNLNGESQETSVFKIHYSKKGVHIVPDYMKKKQRYTK